MSDGNDNDTQGGAGNQQDADASRSDDSQTVDNSDVKGLIKTLRGENAKRRIENKSLTEELSGLKSGLAKALGLDKGDDDSVGMKEVLSAVNKLSERLSTNEAKTAFAKVAQSLGADPDLAFAYITANGGVPEGESLEKVLKAAMKEKPQLKAQTAVKTGDAGVGDGKDVSKTGSNRSMNQFIRRAAGRQ